MEDSHASGFLSWVHFGDLHIGDAHDENYTDFLQLIDDVNGHLAGQVDFAFLPGDNADDGTEDQYKLVKSALDRLKIPVHIIAGDHDKKGGNLDLFRQYLEPNPYRAVDVRGFRLLFLNAVEGAPAAFDLGSEQIQWTEAQLMNARSAGLRPIVFTHLYPSQLATQAVTLSRFIRELNVEMVEMGHTHYNELANDGSAIYAATRSTGQVEEGAPGFSISTVDGDVVSWKFKERGPWPFMMITSPADERLITRPGSPRHVLRDSVVIRARVWDGSASDPVLVTCSLDGETPRPMQFATGRWEFFWNTREVLDGTHQISVRATHEGGEAQDEISVRVSQAGRNTPPNRRAIDYENAISAYPAKGVLGTQLGPNENGTKGPWPSWRGR